MKTNWPEKVWVNSPLRLMIQKRETRLFQSLLEMQGGGAFLEIGCGRGAALPLISNGFHPRRIDAIDLDPEMIRLAGKRNGRMNSFCGLIMAADAQYLPYKENCLDAVFNFGILHHLEDWRLGLKEVARVLKKGGTFYFEEIYSPLYANFLFRHILAHPRENRFKGAEFQAALLDSGLRLLPGHRENRFAILGAALRE